MKKIYTPNLGETSKLITAKIKANLLGNLKKKKPTYRRIEKIKSGSFNKSELKYLVAGCDFLRIMGDVGIDVLIKYLTTGDKELNEKNGKAMILLKAARKPINEFLRMYRNNIYTKYSLQRDIANLENLYEIIDNSRDGVITKKQEIEDSSGQKKEIEIAMSEDEIAHIVLDYKHKLYQIKDNAFGIYLGLGMSVVSLLGGVYPFNVFSPKEKNILNTIENINLTLRTYTGGYQRYEHDGYRNGSPWPIANLWLTLYYLEIGEKKKAKETFDFVIKTMGKHSFLGEQIDNSTLKPNWVIGLGWSHAMFIIVLEKLT